MDQKKNKKIYIETYGCQMNFSDSEIVASVLTKYGYVAAQSIQEADIIFVNTCSIRDHAEQRVKKRLHHFRSYKKRNPELIIGLLGCMAERIKTVLLEEEPLLDVVAGPDAYRDLPRLLEQVESGQRGVNTLLSMEETYADITPVRLGSNGVSAFISIMRGCENYCSYCVVPTTRGQERSRDAGSILSEATDLLKQGLHEVTLLGQNVNSYRWVDGGKDLSFAALLLQVAELDPRLRIRFATSHPKDISDELLNTIAANPNICRAIHLPVQSGSSRILDRMNRKYTREGYMERVEAIRRIIPGCAISTDIITGFCDETEEDHLETLSLMEWARFDYAFLFKYSERPMTLAADTMHDNVPEEVKDRRLTEVINLQQRLSYASNKRDLNRVFEVLIEGDSKRSADHFMGRTSQNKVVVFPKAGIDTGTKPGHCVQVRITSFTSATLLGEVV
ncbi:MAG: tRNA (N6-isopentenyl adenosine(37)-C2)-methylthiotransferase MiaB [Bacteroidetes bacterium]|nr:MAG: tRNA (N6-isopentenyl adenosine(37)-C2)-methylthiotransferase MiaB [Bacteroidota bacterium]